MSNQLIKQENTLTIKKKSKSGKRFSADMRKAANNFTTILEYKKQYVKSLDNRYKNGLTKTEKKMLVAALDLGIQLGQMRPKDKSWIIDDE